MIAELGGARDKLVGVPGEADDHIVTGPRPQPGGVAADAARSDDRNPHAVPVTPAGADVQQ
jgi:hypothetical protein